MRFPRWSRLGVNPASLTIVAILLVVSLYVWGPSILDIIELKTYDLRFLSRGRRAVTPWPLYCVRRKLVGFPDPFAMPGP